MVVKCKILQNLVAKNGEHKCLFVVDLYNKIEYDIGSTPSSNNITITIVLLIDKNSSCSYVLQQ